MRRPSGMPPGQPAPSGPNRRGTMQTFSTEAEFAGAIDASLAALPADIRTALSAGIATGDTEARDTEPDDNGALNLRLGSWVLREQDVPVTELIGIVGVAVTAALAPGVIAAGAIVTALSAFAALSWKAWRKGAKLSKPELAVLGFLQVQGPMTLDELKARAVAALPDLGPTDIDRAIATLQDVELRDGDIVELIRKDAAGLWRARPV